MVELVFTFEAGVSEEILNWLYKAKLIQLNRTQFPSLGIFGSKKVGNQKN